MNDFIFKLLCCLLVVLATFLVIIITVYVPVGIYAEMKCLEQGFSKGKVALDFSRYCMNLEGSVRVKVEKQK